MKSFTSSVGIVGYNMTAQSEVSSNCINDCYVSMNFYGWSWGGNTQVLPLIRNNFLYNYNYVGINVQGYTGNIGTITNPGLNTLWSNNNAAIDINSSSTINVADNFGMFNISFPQVQITSNNPYHSTASCAHQIFNMPSQGNLNIAYDCDNSEQVMNPLSGGSGNFELKPGYTSELKNSSNQFESAAMIMASIDGADLNLLEQMIENTDLSPNEVAILKYDYFSRKALYTEARSSMQSFVASDEFETNFKALSLVNLDVLEHGWQILSEETIDQLVMITATDLQNANYAISLLNNVSGFHNHVVDEPFAHQVVGTGNIKRVDTGHGFLNIYPNPVRDYAYIELFSENNTENKVELYDIDGKLCTQFTINFVAGGIELDISKLKAGIYFVTLTNPDSGFAQKGKLVKIKQD